MIIERVYFKAGHGTQYPWHGSIFYDYCPIDGLRVENFRIADSDYEMGGDQIICPCGAEIFWEAETKAFAGWMADLGRMRIAARQHMRSAHR